MNGQQTTRSRIVFQTDGITESIIGCAMRVHSDLGCGFLEKVYENALIIELSAAGHRAKQQHAVPVHFRGHVVGNHVADLLVDNLVLLELKAVQGLDAVHPAQCKHYLKATGLQVCLLLNFGKPSLEFKRILKDRIR